MKNIGRKTPFLIFMIFSLISLNRLSAQDSSVKTAPTKPFSFPLQLEMRVPFDPTAFPNCEKTFLIYELYLTNFSSSPIRLRRIELLNGDRKNSPIVESFDSLQLKTMVKLLGEDSPGESLNIRSGQSAVVYIEAKMDKGMTFPGKIIHRIVTGDNSLEGAEIRTHATKLQVFTPPVEGSDWIAADGPGNSIDNHHRRGNIILGGRATNSRRFATDWKKVKDSISFSGDPKNVRSYFCYGEKIFAVADGTVISATDGLPDNIPGHGKEFHPAVPLTFENLPGNHIVIDLGNGHYAFYMHMQPGSLQVKTGDHVRKGQLLGNIGNSGDAREPHLHFEVTNSPKLLLGEGIPYVIDYYRLGYRKGFTDVRTHELPKEKEIIDFEKMSK
ncbi:M23 family metallopeptidase [uncultured Chryseobacterium sp.]|uniref:M23 family metallopeptidase n=1 Tax=uncultured Chryseobacterium sp. TaxID=259322 RepID=UPI0025F3389C|nr:M23 family metallopeptidase [uncultured Chryseobacterium sp.]